MLCVLLRAFLNDVTNVVIFYDLNLCCHKIIIFSFMDIASFLRPPSSYFDNIDCFVNNLFVFPYFAIDEKKWQTQVLRGKKELRWQREMIKPDLVSRVIKENTTYVNYGCIWSLNRKSLKSRRWSFILLPEFMSNK